MQPTLAEAILASSKEQFKKVSEGNEALKAYGYFHGIDAVLELEAKHNPPAVYEGKSHKLPGNKREYALEKAW